MKINLKKIIYLLLITVLLISFLNSKALAADTKPILSVETTKDKLVPGEEIIAEVKFNNNNVSECCGVDLRLKYDSNSLEVINSEVVIKTGASVINDKANDSVNFVLLSISPIEYNDTLIKVTFKVKENAKSGETILDILSNNSESPISNEDEDIPTTILSKKITIDSKIKEEANTKSDNKTLAEDEEVYASNENEESDIQIKYNSNITNENPEEVAEEESETEELPEVKTSQKEEIQKGLPSIAIIILIVISIVGVLIILAILKKKKK